jgi:hypothetical protein
MMVHGTNTLNLSLIRHIQGYLSFIRPLFEYGDALWDPHNMYLIDILEKVQIEAMRIISGGTKLTSLRELYKETGLIKVKDRLENHQLI